MENNRKLKEALTPAIDSWDKEGLWLNIEKEIPKKNKRKRFVILFFVGLLTISIVSMVMNSSMDNEPLIEPVDRLVANNLNQYLGKIDANRTQNAVHNNRELISIIPNQEVNAENDLISTNSLNHISEAVKPAVDELSPNKINGASSYIRTVVISKAIAEPSVTKKRNGISLDPLPLIEFSIDYNTVDTKFYHRLLRSSLIMLSSKLEHELLSELQLGVEYRGMGVRNNRIDFDDNNDFQLDSSKPLETIAFDVSYQKTLKSNLGLAIGIKYWRSRVQLQQSQTISDSSVVLVPDAYYGHYDGNLVYFSGEVIEKSVKHNQLVTTNINSGVEVPISISFIKPISSSYSMSIIAGTSLNLYNHNAYAMIEDNKMVSIREHTFEFGLSRVFTAVQVQKQINQNTGISLNLGYTKDLSMRNVGSSTRIKYDEMTLGLRMHRKF